MFPERVWPCLTIAWPAWWCRHPQCVWPRGHGCPAGTSGCPSCPPPCRCPQPHGRTWEDPGVEVRRHVLAHIHLGTVLRGSRGSLGDSWWMVSTPFKGKTSQERWESGKVERGSPINREIWWNSDIGTPTDFVHSVSGGPCSNPSSALEFACAPGRQWHTRSLQPQCPAKSSVRFMDCSHDVSCFFECCLSMEKWLEESHPFRWVFTMALHDLEKENLNLYLCIGEIDQKSGRD